jgi:hypothetical protein
MKRVNLSYHHGSEGVAHTGYGIFGQQLHDALIRAGVEDHGDIIDPDDPRAEHPRLGPVALYAATPPAVTGLYDGQTNVLFTMFEFSDMPAGFRENLPEFDRILVPSQQNVELFSRFHPDVQYVPLAAEKKWYYKERKEPTEYFEFLTAGAGPRKGNEDVVRAFNKVFAGWNPSWGPEPRLTVRTTPTLGNSNFAGDRVRHIGGKISDEAYESLFDAAHCYVSGSKGEGWGLIPFQAIMSGIPTILGNAHGHAAFAHLGIPLAVLSQPAATPTHWGAGGDEWIPDFDQMCEAMLQVYSNWKDAEFKAYLNAHRAADQFSWDKTAQIVIDSIPEMDYSPSPGTWQRLPQRVFPVVVKHHQTFIVNGRMDTFDPGHLYHRPWNMKVLLADAGNLDSSCININEMGTATLPDGGPDRCEHCMQKFGSDTSLYPEKLLAEV